MGSNPTEYWTKPQKLQYLVQVKKLILKIGDRGRRGKLLEKLLVDLDVTSQSLSLSMYYSDDRAKELFDTVDLEDRIFILFTYLLILVEEEWFEYREYSLMVDMFEKVFSAPGLDTILCMGVIFETNPEVELEFHSKKDGKKQTKESNHPTIGRDTIIYLVIMALAIIGLISILT